MNSQSSPLYHWGCRLRLLLQHLSISLHHNDRCRLSKIMRLLFSIFLTVASLSLIQAHQNVSTILSHCDVSQLFYGAPHQEPLNDSRLTVWSINARFKPSTKATAPIKHACARTPPMLQCLTSARLRIAPVLNKMVRLPLLRLV